MFTLFKVVKYYFFSDKNNEIKKEKEIISELIKTDDAQ
jgi:hypothetical protein